MDFSQREIELAIAASMGHNIAAETEALELARQGLVGSTQSSQSAGQDRTADSNHRLVDRQTPSIQDQLAERRDRLDKRKASEDDGSGTVSSHSYKRHAASAVQAPVGNALPPFANGGPIDSDEDAFESGEDIFDMLIDGLDLDPNVRAQIEANAVLKDDLKRQLATLRQGDAGPDTEENDWSESEEEDEAYLRLPMRHLEDAFAQQGDSRISRPALGYTFSDGALRLTRTTGRQDVPNCTSLDELIDKDTLQCACVFAFFIADQEFLPYLPLGRDCTAPLYIGRDVNLDPITTQIMNAHGLKRAGKVTKAQMHSIRPTMASAYAQMHGRNYNAFYPKGACGGCAHSKIMVLIYPTFARLVITSCNMIALDFEHSDNHWYIHDLPRFASNKALKVNTSFEKLLLVHLKELGVPSAFFEAFSGRFDFSAVRVSLVTSRPGGASGPLAESSGLLRLRRVVSELPGEVRAEMLKKGVQLECCTASVGMLEDKWLKEAYDCAIGKARLKTSEYGCDIPDVKIVFPTFEDVENCDYIAKEGASKMIGCHMQWGTAREEIKLLFHHYYSHDRAPYWTYIGSANFSKGAWGRLVREKNGNREDATRGLKLAECVNFECGVLIPREVLMDLLEPGSTWTDIVPYQRPTKAYDLEKDESRPFRPGPKLEKGAVKEK